MATTSHQRRKARSAEKKREERHELLKLHIHTGHRADFTRADVVAAIAADTRR